MNMYFDNDTICAVATPSGMGGIAIIRVSGVKTFGIVNALVRLKKKGVSILEAPTHTLYFGEFRFENELLDEVVVSVFRNPHSYTGEDVAEISCHASSYVQKRIMEALIASGARLAKAGEFTLRAFIHGKMDLSQAEAVADVIASENKASHQIAMKQLRGGFSSELAVLRQKLLDFASLIELELDFSEEDVEFADRTALLGLLMELKNRMLKLKSSFALGNVLKNGISVAIVGRPNAGKSTLLNALLNEEKAIVSAIAGTTRDVIEDVISLEGVLFRFIDTAGLRDTVDDIEKMGIERTKKKIEEAQVVLYMFDAREQRLGEVEVEVLEMMKGMEDTKVILVGNKVDEMEEGERVNRQGAFGVVWVSAKTKEGLEEVERVLRNMVDLEGLEDMTIVSNARHYEALLLGLEDVEKVEEGLINGVPGDLVAIDIRGALGHLGEITGEVTGEDLLGNVFGRFCIGK